MNLTPSPFLLGKGNQSLDRSFFAPSLKERGRGLGERGFTLLEIMVVIFLMGLIMLIAMPYLGGFTSAELKSTGRRLAGRATYLYDEASARKLVIRLVFDMDTNAYYVMDADPYAPQPAFFPDLSTAGRR